MIKYIVNKEKRTVVAVIDFGKSFGKSQETFKYSGSILDRIDDVLACLKGNRNGYTKNYWKKYDKMYFPRYMSAKAKCSPNDEWNEEYGKQLARERLVEKIHNYRSNSYKIIVDMIKEINNNFII